MSKRTVLLALSSRRMASLIGSAKYRIIYAAPGIQSESARALAEIALAGRDLQLTVSLDFDEHTLRMGYGALDGIETLRRAGVKLTHSPGLRCGILVVDDRGWIFTPTAHYLEQEPQSDETPNAVLLTPAQAHGRRGVRASRRRRRGVRASHLTLPLRAPLTRHPSVNPSQCQTWKLEYSPPPTNPFPKSPSPTACPS